MKSKYIVSFLTLTLAYLISSCSESWPYSEEEYRQTWIETYPYNDVTLGKDELTGEFTVRCPGEWYISDNPSWVDIANSSGSGYATVSFTVEENPGTSPRYGYIVIRTNGAFMKETQISVWQEPTIKFDASLLSKESFKADGESRDLHITALSSKEWTITKKASDTWIHINTKENTNTSYKGSGSKYVSVYVDKNTSTSSRSSNLTVKCGTESKKITITQEGGKVQFSATMSTTTYKAEGDWWNLNITSSDSWTITKEDSWVHIDTSNNSSWTYYGSGSKSIRIYVDKNTSTYSRSSVLTVKCGTKYNKITITQEGGFSAYMNYTAYKADGDWWPIHITSSDSWTITKEDSWVHIDTSNNSSWTYYGSGNNSIRIYVDKNTSTYSRSSVLTVKCGTESIRIKITQEGRK